ncbi:unnamed protein product, partial [Symbiodinium microadriaticum]
APKLLAFLGVLCSAWGLGEFAGPAGLLDCSWQVFVTHSAGLANKVLEYFTNMQQKSQKSMASQKEVSQEAFFASQVLGCIEQARRHGGLDSEWTSMLAEAITAIGSMHARVDSILRDHGWLGSQFSAPPRIDELAKDLESCRKARG